MESDKLPLYHLLEGSLHQEHIAHMLGRCVVHKSLPLRDFVPNSSAHLHPKNIVPDIRGEPIEYNDITRILETTVDTTVRAKLTNLLGAAVSQRSKKDLQIVAGTVTRYDMSNPGDTLKVLMDNPTYHAQVMKKMGKLNENKTKEMMFKILPMVVGMLTCKDLTIGFEAEKDRGVDIQGKAPVGTATGTSNTLDSEVQITLSKGNANRLEGKIRQEVIFALAYDEVRLERYFLRRRLFSCFSHEERTSNPEIKHGDPMRTHEGVNLYFGGSDDCSEDGKEQLTATTNGRHTLREANPGKVASGLPFLICYDEPTDNDEAGFNSNAAGVRP